MNESEDRAITQCAKTTGAFVSYIQARDKSLTRAEATWVAAATIDALPVLFSTNESLLHCLDRVVDELKAARESNAE